MERRVLCIFPASGKNPYDIREDCRDTDSGLCYPEFQGIGEWLNRTSIKKALGVDANYDFKVVNTEVQAGFYYKGQAMLNSAALLIPLVNKGIRLLAYAGDVGEATNLHCIFGVLLTDRCFRWCL